MLFQDLRHSLRALRKAPATAAVAVVTLGLGIGGNTAAYTWASALLLRPYPFPDLDSLVTVWERHPRQAGNVSHHGRAANDRHPVAPADFLDLERESRSFRDLAAYRYREHYLVGGGDPERIRGLQGTPDLLPALGVRAALGRTFLADEGRPGHDRVALLTDGFWRRRFAADPGVLGRELTLDELTYTVVGVLPAGLGFPVGGVEVWTPLAFTDETAADRATLSLRVVGRLDGAAALAAAQAETDALAGRLEQTHPASNAGRSFTLVPLAEQQIGLLPPFLLVLQGAAGFVLLIACANVASLLLVRVADRQRELAVRASLGAGRLRVAGLVLGESALLSLAGAALAAALARFGVDLIRTALPPDISKWVAGWQEIRVDARAFGFTLAVAALAALVSGLVPALKASGVDVVRTLKSGPGAAGRKRLRRLVVAGELTLALVLAAGAALLVRGFDRLTGAYRELEPSGALTLALRLPEQRYREPAEIADFFERLAAELGAMPGVESAALVSHLPADLGPVPGGVFTIEGRPSERSSDLPFADFQSVSPAYFPSLRIPKRGGRLLDDRDARGAPPVAVVSESLARRFWPGEDPVGRRLKLGPPESADPWITVVGVVADVRQYWFDEEPRPTLYRPFLQAPRRDTFVVLRSGAAAGAAVADPAELAGPARRRVLALDAAQPVDEVRTLERVVEESLAFVRVAAGLTTVLAVLACLLGAVGVYGLLRHHVAQSAHEIGVRMALGAGRPEVLRLVLGQAAKLALVGIAVGLPAAFALGRLLASNLFGVVSFDPVVLPTVAALLAAVALTAGYVPACRAADLGPAAALRDV